jgi:hypothetical protein
MPANVPSSRSSSHFSVCVRKPPSVNKSKCNVKYVPAVNRSPLTHSTGQMEFAIKRAFWHASSSPSFCFTHSTNLLYRFLRGRCQCARQSEISKLARRRGGPNSLDAPTVASLVCVVEAAVRMDGLESGRAHDSKQAGDAPSARALSPPQWHGAVQIPLLRAGVSSSLFSSPSFNTREGLII